MSEYQALSAIIILFLLPFAVSGIIIKLQDLFGGKDENDQF